MHVAPWIFTMAVFICFICISLSDIFTFDQLSKVMWRVDLVRSAMVVLSPFILFLPAFEGYIDKHVLLENVLTGGGERKKV